ncbi:MAG TPA: TonB-dependent receptor [Alphaproteobacteria bacterium]|nr:TonB-dependent receptor [Alphaproteobacteria bacterium]
MRGLWRPSALAIALTVPFAIQSAPVRAANANPDTKTPSNVIGEVFITATKRTENVQDVPISVSAFTAKSLAEKQVNTVTQLANLTPNVTLDAGTPFSGSSSVLAAYIRGIGQNDFAFNFDPGVGVYVDGVYLARSVGANLDLLDVDHIEILKGPQGTLFGRNTIGGAISIITRDPGDEFAYKGDVTTGSYNRFDVRGSIDMPISDSIKSSLSFSHKYRKGWQKRIPFDPGGNTLWTTDPYTSFPAAGYQSSQREGGHNEYNVRGKVKFDKGGPVNLTLAGDYTNVDQSAQATTLLRTYNLPAAGGAPANFTNTYETCISTPPSVLNSIPPLNMTNGICGPRGYPTSTYTYFHAGSQQPQLYLPALGGANADSNPNNNRLNYNDQFVIRDANGKIDPNYTYSTGNSFSKIKSWGLSATLNWALKDDMNLKSISAYRHLDWSTGMDLDGSPLNFLQTSFAMQQKEWSQEFQLTGTTFNDKLKYVFGAYYFHEQGHLHDFVTFGEGLLQIDGPNDLWTTSYAGFTNLNYDLTSKFSIIAGLRYTHERKKFEGFQHDLNGLSYKGAGLPPTAASAAILGFPDSSDPLRYFPAGQDHQSFDDWSPKFGIQYRPLDQMMWYATYSEGFKSGSWTTRLSNPVLPADRGILRFGPEHARSYEVGVKSEWLDNRLIVNAAGFYTNYKGIQLNFQLGVSPTFKNAGNAHIYGMEVEWQAVVTDALHVTGGFGYIHAAYTSVLPGITDNGVAVTTNSKLPKTPKWKFYIGPQYTVDLGDSGSLLFNGDYTHTASMYNDTGNSPLLFRPATDELNASVTYRTPKDHWELGVGVSNITNERYILNGQIQAAGGAAFGAFSDPREWWVKLSIKS